MSFSLWVAVSLFVKWMVGLDHFLVFFLCFSLLFSFFPPFLPVHVSFVWSVLDLVPAPKGLTGSYCELTACHWLPRCGESTGTFLCFPLLLLTSIPLVQMPTALARRLPTDPNPSLKTGWMIDSSLH